MTTKTRKSVALLLALLQVLVLLPMTAQPAAAADAVPDGAGETPALSPVIRGTLQFGTFNYTSGDEDTGVEGADYTKAFVYTDDYFAASAIQPNVTGKTMDWDKLENPSLATASKDFTIACFGSNEEITEEKNYAAYSKNGEDYLRKCGFSEIIVNDDVEGENAYNVMPSKDSIGVVIGKKTITVWNGERNETGTLIAVGVRGAGYGAEWASNITIGQTGRHQGFDRSAKKVESTLRQYLQAQGITAADPVKYWVVGYSRAGAVANLVAGDITDDPATYFAAPQNVYGYTFESAAGAMVSEDEFGTNYPNIHNIINKMDAVPRVSMPEFGHNRLGVDYLMPYHKNTSSEENAAYYSRMYQILKTIAVGYGGTEDPVVTNAAPDVYPYDRKVDVYELSLAQLALDVVGSNAGNLGLKKFADDSDGKNPIVQRENGEYKIYIDDFLDLFVQRFARSRAWDYNTASETDDALVHRQKYVSQGYQEDLRTFIGAALATPGLGLNAMVQKIQGTVGLGMASLVDEVTSITYDINALDKGETTRKHSWDPFGLAGRINCYTDGGENLATILKYVLENADMFDSQTLSQVKASVDNVSPILFALFARDHANYSAQYTGTVLKYAMDTILVTHTPELVVSWDMSIDDNFISDYREISVPLAADVKVYEFRPQYGETLSANGTGALAAAFENGAGSSSDQRITVRTETATDDSGALIDVQTIRYPADLDLRFDVTSATALQDVYVHVQDLQPVDGVSMKTTTTRAANGNITGAELVETVAAYDTAGAQEINALAADTVIPLSARDTLHILSARDTNQLRGAVSGTFDLSKSVYTNVVVEGQFLQGADGEVYAPDVTAPDGTVYAAAELQAQTAYTAALYGGQSVDGAQTGSRIDAVLPVLAEDCAPARCFTTDASAEHNVRLSTDETPYAAAYTELSDAALAFGTLDRKAALEQEDVVWHVFYNGTVPAPEVKNGLYWEDGELWWYVDDVKTGAGLIEVDGDYYYIKNNGMAVRGSDYYVTKTNGLKDRGVYTFDDAGKMIIPEVVIKNGLIWEDGKLWYYVDNVRTHAGLIYVGGYYYYVKSNGQAVTGSNYFVSNTNDYMPRATHNFDAEGHMTDVPVIKNGLYPENGRLYYYVNDVKTHAGLIQIDGDYYYITTSCFAVAGCDYYVSNTNGLMDKGTYTFGADGKMVVPEPDTRTGVYEEDGELYYYLNGVRTHAGLIEWEGHYYYIKSNCTAVRDCDYFVSNTNDLLPRGTYHFNADGTMAV